MNPIRAATISLTVIFLAAPAWGQASNCLDEAVPLTIVSQDGSRLSSLGPSTFEGVYNGKPIQIKSVTVDRQPRRILILLEVSDGFLWKSDWAKAVAMSLLKQLPPPNEIGLASFSDTLNLLVAPTTDREPIRSQIEILYPKGNGIIKPGHPKAALWDAINGSVKLLDPQRIGDVIFVVADAMNNHSKSNANEAIHTLLALGVRLYAVQLMDPPTIPFRSGPWQKDALDLGRTATQTGGQFVAPFYEDSDIDEASKKPSVLRGILELRAREILTFIRLDLRLPEPAVKERDWTLLINSPDSAVRKNFRLYYPRTILPCNPTPQ